MEIHVKLVIKEMRKLYNDENCNGSLIDTEKCSILRQNFVHLFLFYLIQKLLYSFMSATLELTHNNKEIKMFIIFYIFVNGFHVQLHCMSTF